MAVFHLAHLTDLHFGQFPFQGNLLSNRLRRQLAAIWRGRWLLPPTHNPQRAERAAAWLYDMRAMLEAREENLDALVLSGDLATTGLADDLRAAHRYIDSPPVHLWFRAPDPGEPIRMQHMATLKSIADCCVLIPGNHDRFKSNRCEPGGTEFDSIFDDYWRINDRGVVGKIITKPADDGQEHLAILGADTCLRSPQDASFRIMELSQGYLHDDTVEALKEKTLAARQIVQDIVVVWFVHFPPHASISLAHCMRNYHLLEQEASQLGVALILSGHTHQNCEYRSPGLTTIWNGGSATQYAEPGGNWLQLITIEIQQNKLIQAKRDNFEWRNIGGNYDFHLRQSEAL